MMRSHLEELGGGHRKRNLSFASWMPKMSDKQILCVLLLACIWASAEGHLNRLKVPRHRVGSSKFSLNPLKPLMNLMRQDPMKAAAQRHVPKYLPPPPGMFAAMSHPARTSASPYGGHPYRPYPSHHTRFLPPSTISLMPPYMAASHAYQTYYNDPHNHYRPMPSEMQYKAVRIPSKARRPAASMDSLNIADSVVRQLLDMSHRQTSENNPHPSVLVIEDPDITSSSSSSSSSSNGQDIFSDAMSQSSQKVMLSPPIHAEYAPDSSADISSNIGGSTSGNPEVFVIVSKNKSKNNNNYFLDDKKSDILSSSGSSSKLKKYKITSSYDENGDRQVWIIK
ncbi:hypothetical protein JTE90_007172 [Oedothorax gibbosus]|uniref:Uncharacterized protein n=1 Tax=Oedothorax gibbosus TaxID=931172 RepID=A0AAV6UVP9_9ARAC|nr:hypothetical protein JTE90_007172 [Oedothorax gibbosus]